MLSEKSIKEIEKATGITGLQEIIKSEEEMDVTLTKVFHFNQESYDQLYKNLTEQGLSPEKYEDAKAAGEEMAVKHIKRDMGYEFEGKTVKALNEYLEKKIKLSAETDVSKATAELKADNDKLKDMLSKKDVEISDIQKRHESDAINYEIDSRFNAIQIDVPIHLKDEKEIESYLKREREKAKLHFKSQYDFKRDENKRILAIQNGEVIKDDLLNPKTVDKLMDSYISESFISVQKGSNGRGEGDKLPGHALNDIKDVNALIAYADKKGIKKGTSEFDALYIEFEKNKN